MTAAPHAQYKLSRVFAQGWNAARRLPPRAHGDLEAIGQLNPYKYEPDRGRWQDGFVEGSA
jgi:hypothetical protein